MAFQCRVGERINALPEKVFAAASDFAGAPGRIPGIKRIEMLTDGPVGLGTKFRETRVMFGKEATETMEVVDFQPGRSYTLRAYNCGCEYKTTVSVKSAGGTESEIEFDFSGQPRTIFAKVMTLAMGWLMNGTCVKMIKKDLTSLKMAVEKGAG